jgi:hypothetical protein
MSGTVEYTVIESKRSKGRKKGGSGPAAMKEVRLKPAAEAKVIHQALPPRPPEDKRIHPRRPLPLIREAEEKRPEGDASQQPTPGKAGRSK